MSTLFYRCIWLSDTHLGTREAKSEWLLDFLQRTDSEYLYLVGDIIDMWAMKKGAWHWTDQNTKIIELILEKSRNGTRVIYVPGNHDYGIRKYTQWQFGDIEVTRQALHICKNGERLLITHGDEFDGIIMSDDLITRFGNRAYDVILRANCWLNELRDRFGMGYWSLSSYIKSHIKQAMEYIDRYEHVVAEAASHQGVDGVVCGHIHHPNIRQFDSLKYINTGDWVEHCTAVCEDEAGEISMLNWPQQSAALKIAQDVSLPDRIPEAA